MNELGNVMGRSQACLRACMSGLKMWCISLGVNACPCILYVSAGIITARTTNSAILSVTARLRSIGMPPCLCTSGRPADGSHRGQCTCPGCAEERLQSEDWCPPVAHPQFDGT